MTRRVGVVKPRLAAYSIAVVLHPRRNDRASTQLSGDLSSAVGVGRSPFEMIAYHGPHRLQVLEPAARILNNRVLMRASAACLRAFVRVALSAKTCGSRRLDRCEAPISSWLIISVQKPSSAEPTVEHTGWAIAGYCCKRSVQNSAEVLHGNVVKIWRMGHVLSAQSQSRQRRRKESSFFWSSSAMNETWYPCYVTPRSAFSIVSTSSWAFSRSATRSKDSARAA